MKRNVFVVFLCFIVFFLFGCGEKVHYEKQDITEKYKTAVDNGYTYNTDIIPIPYICCENDEPAEENELYENVFSGVDEKLAVKIAYAVLDSQFGAEKYQSSLLSIDSFLCAKVLESKTQYAVLFGAYEGVGGSVTVTVNKSNGAIESVVQDVD